MSLTSRAFKKKATSLLVHCQDQTQDLIAAKDSTVTMSPFARSATAKNIVRSLTRMPSMTDKDAAQ